MSSDCNRKCNSIQKSDSLLVFSVCIIWIAASPYRYIVHFRNNYDIMTMAPKIAGAVNTVTGAIKGIGAATSGISAVLKVFSGIGLVIGGAITAVKNFIDMFQNGFSLPKIISGALRNTSWMEPISLAMCLTATAGRMEKSWWIRHRLKS